MKIPMKGWIELNVNAYWQSSTLLHLKLAYKYFPEVEKSFKRRCAGRFQIFGCSRKRIEKSTSGSGAKGYWQFMKGTASELNLELNQDVDERMHLEKSTLAACQYIKQLHERFGTWTDAAGAYNVGPTAYAKALIEQRTKFIQLNVNDETSRYVFRIIAFKEILSNPTDFGFYIEDYENTCHIHH